MEPWRILVVEDDTHGRDVMAALLDYYEVSVDVAEDGNQALSLLEANVYTAVLIDLSLPGISGWELLATIRAYDAKLPCFAMTAYHSPRVEHEALEAGFTAYFSKPIEIDSFFEDLAKYLN